MAEISLVDRLHELIEDEAHVAMYKRSVADTLHVFDSVPFVQLEVMRQMRIGFEDLLS